MLIPYLGYKLLPERDAPPGRFENLLRRWRKRALARLPRVAARRQPAHRHAAHDPYATPFYQRFRALVDWCVQRRKTVIAATVAAFVLVAHRLSVSCSSSSSRIRRAPSCWST